MNLTVKVLLAFALVIGVALATASLLIGRSANEAYRGYMTGYQRQLMPDVAEEAGELYRSTGSWTVVQDWLDQVASGELLRGRRGQGAQRMNMASELLLVDPRSGRPLAKSDLSPPGADLIQNGVPVVVDGETLAIIVSLSHQPGLGQAEQALLDEVNRAIGLSALAAGALALVLGGLLISSILRPLHRLEAGVARVSEGDLETRVDVAGNDEIGRLAQEFNRMASNLQSQEALRQNLVADIAHELRTPLSVVQGNLQAILDDVYPLEREEIALVFSETQLLSRLVADLHELAQAEAGKLSLFQQPVQAAQVLQRVDDAFRSLAKSHDIDLRLLPVDAGLVAYADPDRLQQILHNLLGNAIRHTPDGGVIQLGATSMLDDSVRFWVSNSGSAIKPDELVHVFDRFYRVAAAERKDGTTAGSGMGLTITKALVEAHGGSVGAQSGDGEGTTFWFTLPGAPANAPAS